MNLRIAWISVLFIFISFVFAGVSSSADPKPFERAVILTGGSFNAAAYIGAYDGLVESGKAPDIILSTCGTSIATAIIKAFPNPKDRLKFLQSHEFHQLLRRATVNFIPRLYPVTVFNLLEIKILKHIWQTYPDVFDSTLYNVPADFGSASLHVPFNTDSPRAVIVASKLYFGPEYVDLPLLGRKVYQETYFTDSDTARYLKNVPSPIALEFPESAVMEQTDVLTNYDVATASRASISDPYLINPIMLDGHYFLTGAIDHYPLELAHRLANEVIDLIPSSMGAVGEDALKTVFEFDLNERRNKVLAGYADYWVDFTNDEFNGKEVGFGDVKYGISLGPAVPENYEEFVKGVTAQYAFGHFRAEEALASKVKNSRSHLREP